MPLDTFELHDEDNLVESGLTDNSWLFGVAAGESDDAPAPIAFAAVWEWALAKLASDAVNARAALSVYSTGQVDTALALKAPIASPTFTGTPAAPTATLGTNTTQLATTAFVKAAVDALIAAAPGALDTLDELAAALGDDANFAATLTAALALKAPLASPALTGTPTVPTASLGTNTTQAASTAFVAAAIAALINSAPGALDTLNELAAALGNDASFATTVTNALALKAPLASPALTGTPTAPTASLGTNTTQIASTAFVAAAITALVNSAPGALDTLNELAAALGNDASFATTITNALALKAPLASPALTGTPTAPTATPGTSTTQVATSAFATSAGDPLDVFLLGGQSNIIGLSDAATYAMTIPTGKGLQYYSGTLANAVEPVAGGTNGTAWGAFFNSYYAATGRKALLVQAAAGGSSQVDAGGNTWDVSNGSHLGLSAITKLNDGITAARAAGYTPRFKGMVWGQGEYDAGAIVTATITKAQYKAGLIATLAYFRGATIDGTTYPQMPVWVSLTGATSAGVETGSSQVAAAQEEVAEADPFTHIGFSGAPSFYARGLMSTLNHYKQEGYNEMGRVLAQSVLGASATPWLRMGATTSGWGTDNIFYRRGNVLLGRVGSVAPSARLVVTENDTGLPAALTGSLLQLVAVDGSNGGALDFAAFGGVPSYQLRRSEGTAASPTATLSGSSLGGVSARGYGATGWAAAAKAALTFFAAENWTDSAQGTHGTLRATLIGATTLQEALRWMGDKRVLIATTTAAAAWLSLAGGTTAFASLNIPTGVAPTSPANGDIWFDGTDIKIRVGGTTKTFTLA